MVEAADDSRTGIRVDYKIESVIGKGSFATVRKGKFRSTGEKVAIKIISKRKLSEDDRQALQNEIEILKQVDHPNIVKCYDIYEDEKYIYIVMEFLQGGELFDQILKKEKFTEREARDIVAPIFDALDYCHGLGIVHRDIKPENLLFSNKDVDTAVMKVSDFGLARFVGEEVFATTTCGTPGYVAPEILREKPYSHPCDFWSVGVVLYILLTGAPPFYDEDNFELFEKIKRCEYDISSSIWDQISKDARDFVSKLLVAAPEDRLTAKQIREHPWITATSAPTTSINVLERMRGWNTKRKLELAALKPQVVAGDDDKEFKD